MSENFYGGNIRQRSDKARQQTEGLIAKCVLKQGFNKVTLPDAGGRSKRVTISVCGYEILANYPVEIMVYITKDAIGDPQIVDLIDTAQVTRYGPYVRSPVSMSSDEIIVIYSPSSNLVARIEGYQLL